MSGIQFGKPMLEPADQSTLVDRTWNDFFPESPVKSCPLFDNFKEDGGDVMKLGGVPNSLKCHHVIIAGPNYSGDGLMARFMVRDEIWNGVTHQTTTWDQTLGGAIAEHLEKLQRYKEEYAAKLTPTDEWIAVTVDYHS